MTNAENIFFEEFKTTHNVVPFDRIEKSFYEEAVDSGIKQADREIEVIVNQRSRPTFENTIEALENAGEMLNRTLLTFYPILSADGDEEMNQISLRIAPKLRQCAVGPQKRLLRQVGHQIHIAHHAADQALDATLVLHHQQAIGLLIASNRALHQLQIGVVGTGGSGRRRSRHKVSSLRATGLQLLLWLFSCMRVTPLGCCAGHQQWMSIEPAEYPASALD